MSHRAPDRRTIGDDWVFDELIVEADGTPSSLTTATLQVLYFAPGVTIPSGADITDSCSITEPPTAGLVHVVVPNALTAMIPSLPAGRKASPAHVQILTVVSGIRSTRRVLIVEPVDPSTLAPSSALRGDPDYEPLRFLGSSVLL